MAFENKEGCGALFPNRKQNDRQPDFRGDAMFEGRPIKIAGWWKQSSKGGEYLSLKVEAKQDAPPSDAPGSDGPPRGSYRDNRAARQPSRGPSSKPVPADAPFGEEQHFSPDDVPFAWSGRSTLPL